MQTTVAAAASGIRLGGFRHLLALRLSISSMRPHLSASQWVGNGLPLFEGNYFLTPTFACRVLAALAWCSAAVAVEASVVAEAGWKSFGWLAGWLANWERLAKVIQSFI